MPDSVQIAAGVGATFQLFRLSIDLISHASQQDAAYDKRKEAEANAEKKTKESVSNGDVDGAMDGDEDEMKGAVFLGTFALCAHFAAMFYFLIGTILISTGGNTWLGESDNDNLAFDGVCMSSAAVSSFLYVVIQGIRDNRRKRFSHLQRTCLVMSTCLLFLSALFAIASDGGGIQDSDLYSIIVLSLLFLLSIIESKKIPHPKVESGSNKNGISKKALMIILKPYFWPDATASSAFVNRVRAMLTWTFVAGSKTCGLIAPAYIGKASTALATFDYDEAYRNIIVYVSLMLLVSFFKEMQSIIYLKVAQAAFVQLSEKSFRHLHSLSLDWHVKKKLGEVIRQMDRGIQACDLLMKYLFLWLLPAILECLLVTIIFATYFNFFPLAIAVFFFVFAYINLTVVITLWRKKFRKSVAKSDNDWHDKCTDSLINFETVKYFTAEQFEIERFSKAVSKFQRGSVAVQASLGFLNISQQILLQACLGVCLVLAAYGIRDRLECCADDGGCEENDFDCCSSVSQSVCPGMNIGDFVAVLTYTINLFIPLTFLGSVYNMVVTSLIDLTDLSTLLAESPDVKDAPDALPLPPSNASEPSTAVEFDNVIFNYPSQEKGTGLKGLSFKMKKGTTTAIVGPTGAGKTTVSRLLFRFYDVVGGTIKVNGVDVRSVKQVDLRSKIGVVPQHASLFNDSIGYNIRYGKIDATEEDLHQVAKDAQVDKFIDSLPEKWDTLVGDRGLKLSGGERQRTAIARCLLKNPPIVLLDEATSALDTITEASVQAALDRLGEDRTVLVIAHRLGTIRNADNIIVLKDGTVAEEGNHDQLLKKQGTYADMWNMQLHSTSSSMGNLIE